VVQGRNGGRVCARTISWTDSWRDEVVLQRVKEEGNVLQTIKLRKANCIGHILRRNCLLKRVFVEKIERRIEVTGRLGRGSKQLLDDLKETGGYCKLREETLELTVWRTGFGRCCGPVVRNVMNLQIP
jgi:hypothetical protein